MKEKKATKVLKKDAKKDNLQELIVHGMKEKKASDITIIDLKSIKNAVADYFIICSGNSDTQVEAITDSIENEVYKITSQDPWHKEGRENNEWVLLDYVNVVAHVFLKDRRKFYSLEELWGDAKIINIENEF
ncbi:MAG: ribosome silencing factor [Cytophagaceae bacterium]|nr:ribosome silencing factor [Cytophagaceae bacterium]